MEATKKETLIINSMIRVAFSKFFFQKFSDVELNKFEAIGIENTIARIIMKTSKPVK